MTVIRSEREAWEFIKRHIAKAQRRGITVDEMRALLIECDIVADNMLAQLYEGIHKNPKRSRRKNPPKMKYVGGVAYYIVREAENGKILWLEGAAPGVVAWGYAQRRAKKFRGPEELREWFPRGLPRDSRIVDHNGLEYEL